MSQTKIEWADAVWNPVSGCTKISPGCQNCYAERTAKTRLAGRFGYPADEPFRVTLHPDRLDEPLRRKKPTVYFVCSMGDLFHEDVPDEFISRVWNVAFHFPRHTFLFLTKRPGRNKGSWPRNAWLGVSVEDQKTADERIPKLLDIPTKNRFLSVEPLLGPVEIPIHSLEQIPGVIVGGESGPGARPMHPDWVRSLKTQCEKAGVMFYLKQWGEWSYEGFEANGRPIFSRVGKKAAGRLLGGREYNALPWR